MRQLLENKQIAKLNKIMELIYIHLSGKSFNFNYSPNEAIRCIYARRSGIWKGNPKQAHPR
jgi:hypothetical protein